jgi:hypothetical protein
VLDPDASLLRLNRSLVYLGACVIAGLLLAREQPVNVKTVFTRVSIEESADLAHEVFYLMFRKRHRQVKRVCALPLFPPCPA